MLKKIGIAVVIVLAVLAAVIASRPASFRVARSIDVAAPADKVYAQIADFHRWDAWSPWARLDPSMKTTFQGPDATVGSSYFWTGNDKVGEGRMTLTALEPARRVDIKLEFIKPFEATNACTFDLLQKGAATSVTWSMEGKNNFVGKAFSLVMNMDKMVGGDFEKGLQQLKALAESSAGQATK